MRNLSEMTEDFYKFSKRDLQSCLPKEPLTKLDGTGKASVLNYNLPQSTCFTAVGYTGLSVAIDAFKDELKAEPKSHFWNETDGLTADQIQQSLQTGHEVTLQGGNELLEFESEVKQPIARSVTTDDGTQEPINQPIAEPPTINNLPVDNVANQISKGYRPYYRRNLYGTKELRYAKKPSTIVPQIIIVEHYRVCSYLGDYGAGKTLKTFSLLPGERTEITLKTYKNSSEVKSKAENILDSFSEDSAKELENLIEDATDSTTGEGRTVTNTFDVSFKSKIDADIDITLFGKGGSLGAEVEAGTGYRRTATNNSSRLDNIKTLNRAMDKHVSKSSAVREVQVNTETTTTVETGEETTIVRTLENINKSRVLNFVFRQLLQEYFTITYLEDITLVFTNGYPESTFTAKLDNIDGFLAGILKNESDIDKAKSEILNELSSVYDYTGTRQRFVEKVTQDIFDIEDNVVAQQHYYRKKSDLAQTYRDKTVPGVILDVQHRMLRTDSVIVDALLGQGEALDCFNLRLQEAANMKAYIETFALYLQQLEKQQAIDIIDTIQEPETKADLYKRVFGDCCKELQTTVIHNDFDNQ